VSSDTPAAVPAPDPPESPATAPEPPFQPDYELIIQEKRSDNLPIEGR